MRALLTLYLLAFATSAHAECAWVLWSAEVERRDGKTLRRQWVPHSGAESVGECRKAMLDSPGANNSTKRKDGLIEAMILTDGSTFFEDASRPGSGVYFKCLPDTVDPRGAKGSK